MGNYDAFYKGQEIQKNNMDDAPPVCSLFNEFRNILGYSISISCLVLIIKLHLFHLRFAFDAVVGH